VASAKARPPRLTSSARGPPSSPTTAGLRVACSCCTPGRHPITRTTVTPCGTSLTAPRHSPAVRRAGLCRQGIPRAQRAKSPSGLHLWQKRGVFGVIKRELRRRSAIEPIIGHLKAEGHLGPATSKAARRRCRQRPPPSRGPQLPPHRRLAASSLAPYPGGSHRTHQRPVGPQISFLTDDQIWTRFNPTGDPLTDLSLEVGRRLKYWDAMHYFFHIFDGSKLFPDDAGNNLPSLEYAKQMAEVVADELKKGGEFCRSSLVIVSDENGKKLFECSAS
jgi:hypothetical protein